MKAKEFFKKLYSKIERYLPTRRRLIQVYAMLLFNANLKGFATGTIYLGPLKNMCTPGLNCYSCPGAALSCPLGALQNALIASNKTAPYFMVGILILFGFLFGRWICGFLCPFGLIQDLLYKIKSPKAPKGSLTRALSGLKYVFLLVFVIILPLMFAMEGSIIPAFCKYVCPAGTLGGAIGLLSHPNNVGSLSMLGGLFTWKFIVMVVVVITSIFTYRFFCRFICPLGAIYSLFNKVSLIGITYDKKTCIDCGKCVSHCKMDIKHVGDRECISCGECIPVCPTKAISWKGGKFKLHANEIDTPVTESVVSTEENKGVESND
ncbi:MAG: 4Fe-4S binding protein [Clostridia bacterium]|nr:4Fe-4S binding protein [Clostridia bacterium]